MRKKKSLCLHGLESARGFYPGENSPTGLQTRYTPVLKFVIDPGHSPRRRDRPAF